MNTPRRRPPATKRPSPVGRWLPALAAVGVLGVVVVAGAVGNDKGSGATAGDTTTTGTGVASSVAATTDSGYGVTGLTVPASTLPGISTATTLVPTVKTALNRTLVSGLSGDDVKALQTRIKELGFDPGVADGIFGGQTQQAVWAFEKLILRTPRAQATGKVTNDMWQRMQDPIVIQPRRPGAGTHVEIYLPEQVAAVFTDDTPILVMHISSGTGQTWCDTVRLDTDSNGNPLDPPQEKAVCGVSTTPGGVFTFQREVQGDRVGALGRMFNPVYFNYGIAMHGAGNVPLEPASHGCIRMHKTISNTFQSLIHLRDRVYVWGEDGKEPEQYTKKESTPIFNYRDPSATTTTSTTTTTTTVKPTTTTTTPPTTTAKPAVTATTAKQTPTTMTTTATAQPATTSAPTTSSP